MVKRLLKYWWLLPLLIVALAIASTGWIVGTTGGARWLLRQVSSHTPVRIEAGNLEGRLMDRLVMERLDVAWPGGRAAADSMTVRWHPFRLLLAHLSFEELSARGVTVVLEESKQKQPAEAVTWPRVAGLATKLHGTVERLHVQDLRVVRNEQLPFRLKLLRSRLLWRTGILTLSDFSAVHAAGEVKGEVAAGFLRPFLSTNLTVAFYDPAMPLSQAKLKVQSRPARAPSLFGGDLVLEATARQAGSFRVHGDFLLQRDRLRIAPFEITSPERGGTLKGKVEMAIAPGPFSADAELALAGIDLSRDIGTATDIHGTITLHWENGSYRGRLDLADRTKGWRRVSLSGAFQGDKSHLSLSRFSGKALSGKIAGSARLSWKGGIESTADLRIRGINPGLLAHTYDGKINADLQGAIAVKDSSPFRAEVSVQLHESYLRGLRLLGEARGSVTPQEVVIAALHLQGDGFEATASGPLSERVDFTLDISSISHFVAEASGSLNSEGWIRRTGGRFFGSVAGTGSDISFDGLGIGEAGFTLAREATEGEPFVIDIKAQHVSYQELQVETAAFSARGTIPSHRAALALAWENGAAEAAIDGGYAADTWTGTVTSLVARQSDIGSWHASSPFVLSASNRHLALSPFELVSIAGERISGGAALSLAPLRGMVNLAWQNLDLSDANPFLDDLLLAGQSSGAVEIRRPDDGSLSLSGWMETGGVVALEQQEIRVLQALTEIDWDRSGLQGRMNLALADGGTFFGTFSSPHPARFALPSSSSFELDWESFNLGLLQPWLGDATLIGQSSGRVRGRWLESGRLDVAALASATAVVGYDGVYLEVDKLEAEVDWDQSGLHTLIQAKLSEGGEVEARLTSKEPSRLRIPEAAEVALNWRKFNLALLHRWIPENIGLAGALSGETQGRLMPDGRFRMAGKSQISGGEVSWRTDRGILSAALRQAELSWQWSEEAISGDTSILLEDYGRVEGVFSLPIPGRLPVAVQPQGRLHLDLRSEVKEQGILSALLPGLVNETRGNLSAAITIGGTWEDPDLGGRFLLSDAAASLPIAGIRLTDSSIAAHLEGDRVVVDEFKTNSGPGYLAGSGSVRLAGFKATGYTFGLQGEKFQTVRLPELQVQVSPSLSITGTPERVSVRGELRVPELLVLGRQGKGPVEESPDVVIVDAPEPPEQELPVALDLEVLVVLGERVLIKAYGIDAKLGGSVTVKAAGLDDITGQGEIKVEKGTYATYGVKLDIARGSLLFTGAPIRQPTLDILALRTIKEPQPVANGTEEPAFVTREEIKAGVQITGTPLAPVVKLYSNPPMPDTDILAYIVLGHPLGQDPAQADLLMLSAGALLSKGESVVLQERLKSTLGLDVLQIQAGGGDVSQSMVTVGKYLSPRLYISYGRYLFTSINEFRLRYSISRHWEVQSVSGVETGVDLFYRIQFR